MNGCDINADRVNQSVRRFVNIQPQLPFTEILTMMRERDQQIETLSRQLLVAQNSVAQYRRQLSAVRSARERMSRPSKQLMPRYRNSQSQHYEENRDRIHHHHEANRDSNSRSQQLELMARGRGGNRSDEYQRRHIIRSQSRHSSDEHQRPLRESQSRHSSDEQQRRHNHNHNSSDGGDYHQARMHQWRDDFQQEDFLSRRQRDRKM